MLTRDQPLRIVFFLVHRRFLPQKHVSEETGEDEHGSEPLPSSQRVAEEDHREQNGKELPGRGDDGTGQRPKARHHHEDEELTDGTSEGNRGEIQEKFWVF